MSPQGTLQKTIYRGKFKDPDSPEFLPTNAILLNQFFPMSENPLWPQQHPIVLSYQSSNEIRIEPMNLVCTTFFALFERQNELKNLRLSQASMLSPSKARAWQKGLRPCAEPGRFALFLFHLLKFIKVFLSSGQNDLNLELNWTWSVSRKKKNLISEALTVHSYQITFVDSIDISFLFILDCLMHYGY